jgi:hypothetical protein
LLPLPVKTTTISLPKTKKVFMKALEHENQNTDEVYDLAEELERDGAYDGQDMTLTWFFKPYNLYVTLAGTYSSWGDSRWHDIFVSEPYTYEVRSFKRKE